MSTFQDFRRQFYALAKKNALLKTRYIGTLFLELAVPTMVIICIGLVSKSIEKLKYAEVIPNSYQPIGSFVDSTNNVFTTSYLCFSFGNLVWNCKDRVMCDSDYNVDINSLIGTCQPKRIAVAPSDFNDAGQNQAAMEFVGFATELYDYYNLSTFTYFQSESAFISYIMRSDYGIDPNLPIYSGAIIFTEGYPSWKYTLRLNVTYTSVSIFSCTYFLPTNRISSSNILTKEKQP